MPVKNTTLVFGSVAKFFHWTVALLIFGLLILGFVMEGLPLSPDKFKWYGLHKSIGITVLVLALLRLAWKTGNVSPRLPAAMRYLEKMAAHGGHMLLYVLMIGMPLSGWAMSSAKGLPVSVFGFFTLPDFVAADKALGKQLQELHEFLAYGLVGVVSLHVLAALLHHFYYKDNVLRRMLPFGKVESNVDVTNPDTAAD